MERTTFVRIGRQKQLEALLQDGILLAETSRLQLSLQLFSLYNFYVEVYLMAQTREIIIIHSFQDLGALDAWLQEIDISELG